jgi:hypothetical protein
VRDPLGRRSGSPVPATRGTYGAGLAARLVDM